MGGGGAAGDDKRADEGRAGRNVSLAGEGGVLDCTVWLGYFASRTI